VRLAAFAAFFLSGASSLIFQNIWARMLHHVFGATGVAVSTVVTVFMAGLGLGAFVAGRYVDRFRHPLLLYAAAELMVGLWALGVPRLLDAEGWLAVANQWMRAELGAESLGFMLGRFACVVPVLLVPTTLMGASLPLLARHFVGTRDESGHAGSSVGALYAVNTLGAVAGVFLAGFVLMPTVGVALTNLVGVAFNVLLGLGIAAIVLVPKLRGRPPRPEVREATDASPPEDVPAARVVPVWVRRMVLFAFAASGATALAYEVAWTRALAMTLGASIYSFALILVTFLIGIAGGSAVASVIMFGRGRLLGGAAVTAVALSPLAAAPWGFAEGLLPWGVVTVGLVAAVALIHRIATQRLRTTHLPGAASPVGGPAVAMVAVPLLAAGGNALLFPGQLSAMVAAVVATVVALVAVLIGFRRHPVLQLALVQFYVGAATFVNYLFQDAIPCTFAGMVASLPSAADHVGMVQAFMFLTAALCTLPATLGMGAMFPLTLRLWSQSGASVARDVGVVYASNTLGSIVGAWLPGFVLMPLFGLERTLHIGIWLNLALALMLALASGAGDRPRGAAEAPSRPRRGMHGAAVSVLAVVLPALAALLYFGTARPDSVLRWDLSRMTLGVFRLSMARNACDPEAWGQPEIVYYRDGLVTTVSVERWGRHLALKNNGKVEASNGDDMPTQIMVSALPLMMHPEGPEGLDVAVVGFGSGVSVGSVLQFPVARVDVMELERAVVEASRWFHEVNHLEYGLPRFPYVTNERLEVHNDDGRTFLASASRQYDVIISEPSNPWITGVSDLFTEEHFRITRRRLAPGGIYCQWVQLYELSPLNIKTIMRTFASHFEHVVVFSSDDRSSDTILLGSDAPLPLDLERVARGMGHPEAAAELTRAFVRSPHDVLARVLLADRDEVMQYTLVEERRDARGRWVADAATSNGPDEPCVDDCRRVPAPLNTDDNARIEFSAPRDLIGYERYDGYLFELYTSEWPYGHLHDRIAGVPEDPGAAAATYTQMAWALAKHGRMQRASEMLARGKQLSGADETAVVGRVLDLFLDDALEPAPVLESPTPARDMAPERRRRLLEAYELIRAAVAQGAHGPALEALEAIPSTLRAQAGPPFRFLYGYLLYQGGDADRNRYVGAASVLEDLLHTEEHWVSRHPEVFYFLARSLARTAEFDTALQHMRRYVEGLPLRGHDAAPAADTPPAVTR
jgi:spermidine synthase/MFS family permease